MDTVYFDLSAPRPAHVSHVHEALVALKPGEEYIHDHGSYTVSFSVWIAQARRRHHRKYHYEVLSGTRTKLYRIWVQD